MDFHCHKTIGSRQTKKACLVFQTHLICFRYVVGHYVTIHDDVISHVNISRVESKDGGSYSCTATNTVGAVTHVARLNIYGKGNFFFAHYIFAAWKCNKAKKENWKTDLQRIFFFFTPPKDCLNQFCLFLSNNDKWWHLVGKNETSQFYIDHILYVIIFFTFEFGPKWNHFHFLCRRPSVTKCHFRWERKHFQKLVLIAEKFQFHFPPLSPLKQSLDVQFINLHSMMITSREKKRNLCWSNCSFKPKAFAINLGAFNEH